MYGKPLHFEDSSKWVGTAPFLLCLCEGVNKVPFLMSLHAAVIVFIPHICRSMLTCASPPYAAGPEGCRPVMLYVELWFRNEPIVAKIELVEKNAR